MTAQLKIKHKLLENLCWEAKLCTSLEPLSKLLCYVSLSYVLRQSAVSFESTTKLLFPWMMLATD